MPSITTPTYAEVVKEVIGAVGAVQDAHATMAGCANDLLTAKEKFPVLEEALAGKQGTFTNDTTKVGAIYMCQSYTTATIKKQTLPAGGTWLCFYCTSFPYGSDRAAGVDLGFYPGGTVCSGLYAWWVLSFRVS